MPEKAEKQPEKKKIKIRVISQKIKKISSESSREKKTELEENIESEEKSFKNLKFENFIKRTPVNVMASPDFNSDLSLEELTSKETEKPETKKSESEYVVPKNPIETYKEIIKESVSSEVQRISAEEIGINEKIGRERAAIGREADFQKFQRQVMPPEAEDNYVISPKEKGFKEKSETLPFQNPKKTYENFSKEF